MGKCVIVSETEGIMIGGEGSDVGLEEFVAEQEEESPLARLRVLSPV